MFSIRPTANPLNGSQTKETINIPIYTLKNQLVSYIYLYIVIILSPLFHMYMDTLLLLATGVD